MRTAIRTKSRTTTTRLLLTAVLALTTGVACAAEGVDLEAGADPTPAELLGPVSPDEVVIGDAPVLPPPVTTDEG